MPEGWTPQFYHRVTVSPGSKTGCFAVDTDCHLLSLLKLSSFTCWWDLLFCRCRFILCHSIISHFPSVSHVPRMPSPDLVPEKTTTTNRDDIGHIPHINMHVLVFDMMFYLDRYSNDVQQ